jgi:hypothetical protein
MRGRREVKNKKKEIEASISKSVVGICIKRE